MIYIGHLDMVRYFQKVNRRADVDVAYSEGFSPHQKMSFAAPLSVGVYSQGEYFDMEVNSTDSTNEMLERMNAQNVDGVRVLSYKLLPEDAKNAMSVVAGADYLIHYKEIDGSVIDSFMAQKEINVIKKTKKSEKEVNIRDMIYEMSSQEDGIYIKLAQGSAANLKPQLVMEALSQFAEISLPDNIMYERLDMYCMKDDKLVSLDEIGGNID